MINYLLLFLFFSYNLFSQISLPTFHGIQKTITVENLDPCAPAFCSHQELNNFQSGDPLIIAGGGGGEIYQYPPHAENHATTCRKGNCGNHYDPVSYSSSWASVSIETPGGINGNGGTSGRGGGGGGFLTDGGEDSRRPGTRGRSFANGGEGGTRPNDQNVGEGGFGGGGASIRVGNSITDQGAGGGGGYSGGGGGGANNRAHGGGGGSYNAGANQVNASYPNGNNGHGKVIITQGGSTWTFTNCGDSGKTGPTQNQCNSSYSGTSLAGNVTLVDGIQSWTIPTTATYTIKAYGAQGGTQTSFNSRVGGQGTIMQGDFTLASGTVLKILVGHQPSNVAWLNGGGGGTFIVLSN